MFLAISPPLFEHQPIRDLFHVDTPVVDILTGCFFNLNLSTVRLEEENVRFCIDLFMVSDAILDGGGGHGSNYSKCMGF